MLSKLLYEYTQQKAILEEKHKIVVSYLNNKDDVLNLDLNSIYSLINNGIKNKPYNINITDENYIVRNTTYKPELGFSLAFAKNSFDEHFKNNEIGISTPIFVKASKSFLSFSDSYLSKNKEGILQLSYNYSQTNEQLESIRKNIDIYKNIKEAKAYIVANTGFVNDLIIKDFKSYRASLKEIEQRHKEGQKVNEKLKDKTIYVNEFVKDDVNYKSIYFSTNSAIFDDTKIVFSFLLDESEYYRNLEKIDFFMILLTLIGLIAIIILVVIRNKEVKLSQQDKFVQSAMHELKTPLSIITLNNDLRKEKLGNDEYTSSIDSAVKILQNSYNDMSYVIKNEKESYNEEILDLEEILEERVEYFQTIAKANDRDIKVRLSSECQVKISFVELTRLIDNNLSNAIKYSFKNTVIDVSLENDLLQIKSEGEIIKDTSKIFNKYYRENKVVGGYGLGLSIVKNIAKKYNIETSVNSQNNQTIFSYKFKCHFDDI